MNIKYVVKTSYMRFLTKNYNYVKVIKDTMKFEYDIGKTNWIILRGNYHITIDLKVRMSVLNVIHNGNANDKM